jgi:peroxiredoxin family protein
MAMNQQSPRDHILADPALQAYVAELVEQKVAERFDRMQTSMDQALQQVQPGASTAASNRATLFVFSGDMDRLMSAFMIATGAAAMDLQVTMFFTFWSLVALKKTTRFAQKSLPQKMLSTMLPSGPNRVGTSKMNMLGMGPILLKMMMGKQNVETLPELIALAQEMEVRLVACQMAMGVMGIQEEELIDGIEYGGIAMYLDDATDSKLTLYI